jgi:hypothetical protein
MEDYEAQRLENLKQKQQLLAQLNLDSKIIAKKVRLDIENKHTSKKRKLNTTPVRSSERIASSETNPSYAADSDKYATIPTKPRTNTSKSPSTKRTTSSIASEVISNNLRPLIPTKDISSIRYGWISWTPTAPPPSRDHNGTFHFPSHPTFTPNKSPSEIIHEGSFGGSCWRLLRSQRLGIIIQDDCRELPREWIEGLDVSRYLTNSSYDASANKFGVVCGQSIEEWEAAGWINHTYDVRGWFQWYCRFFQGRRCEDDERQVGRWSRCVGLNGRWRKALLRKYVQHGVKEVFDDGEHENEVSPVMHQTCHHWGFEVRQGVLDEFWRTG